MLPRQTFVMLAGIFIILLKMSLVSGKLWSDDGLIKNVKHSSCKPVPGVEGRMLRSLPKPTTSDSCPSKGIVNVGPGNCEVKKGEMKKDATVKIFVTDGEPTKKIFVSDLQDKLRFTSIPATKDPHYMTYDSVDKKIYWSDFFYVSRVLRADLDGGNMEFVTYKRDDEEEPGALAISESSRTLYVVYDGKIESVMSVFIGHNSSLPSRETEFAGIDDFVLGVLAVDEEQRYLYWTADSGKIKRKSLDGNGITQKVYENDDLSTPSGLSIGPMHGGLRTVFFCSESNERTFYIEVNADGKVERTVELTQYLHISGKREYGRYLHSITYFNGVLYWTKIKNPPSIAVMTNYQNENRAFEIRETKKIKEPYWLLFITVDP